MTDSAPSAGDEVRIDLGCGAAKRPGYIGLDYVDLPGVDHVLDLTRDSLPFADDSVDELFSAHFLEHITEPNHVLAEIGRVCRDGAHIEIWTPYAFSNEAFLYGHAAFLTETLWFNFCVSHGEMFADMLRGRWQLNSVTFVIKPEVVADLRHQGVPIDFAVKYHKGIVEEFGVDITYRADLAAPVIDPARRWANNRSGERYDLTPPPAEPAADRAASWPGRLRSLVPESIKAPARSLRRR